MSSDTITHWIGHLKAGDPAAAQKLWERYVAKLVGLARKKLQRGCAQRRVADEEDVALSAFDSFCRGAAEGRFPLLTDRNDLWGLLVVITARKAWDQIRHERSLRQGGGQVKGEAALREAPGLSAEEDDEEAGLAQVIGREPSPALAAQMAEDFQHLLDRLPNAEMRSVALGKLEGYTNGEIAARLGCAEITVERRLRIIRTLWDDKKGRP
jgi:DNA-directed RNA polymerase specialized sigma24 family protein